jgi:hypothetical protein
VLFGDLPKSLFNPLQANGPGSLYEHVITGSAAQYLGATSLTVLSEFAHGTRYGDPPLSGPGRFGQHVESRPHRERVRVVAVVDDRESGKLQTIQPGRGELEVYQSRRHDLLRNAEVPPDRKRGILRELNS